MKLHEVVGAYADAHSILFSIRNSLIPDWTSGNREDAILLIEHAMRHIRTASSELQNSFDSKWAGVR